MSNIREEKGYTYGISAGLVSCPGSSVLFISSETANEYVEPLIDEVYREMDRLCHEPVGNEELPLIDEVYREMDRLCHEPVGNEELSMVKNYMLGELCRNYESAFSLSDAWIYLQTSRLPATYFGEVQEAISQVTAEELLSAR